MMKKLWIISIAAVATLTITGGVLAAQSGQFIEKSKAKEAALSVQEGKVEEIELDREHGKAVYEVEIENNDQDVEVKVDAVTGSIVKVNYDDDTKQKQAVKQDTASKSSQAQQSTVLNNEQEAVKEQSKSTTQDAKQSSSSRDDDSRITKEQAIAIALKIVDGKVVDVELDKDDGVLIYEIEIKSSEVEADIEVAAYGGKVLSKDIDYDDDRDDDGDHDDYDDRYDDDRDDDDDLDD